MDLPLGVLAVRVQPKVSTEHRSGGPLPVIGNNKATQLAVVAAHLEHAGGPYRFNSMAPHTISRARTRHSGGSVMGR